MVVHSRPFSDISNDVAEAAPEWRGSRAGGMRIIRTNRFSAFSGLLLLFWALAVCSHSSVQGRSDDKIYEVETVLDWEEHDRGRVVLYSLPKTSWPRRILSGRILPHLSGRPLFTGLDALSEDNFNLLRGRSFALLTNSTGLDRNLKSGLDLMLEAGVKPSLVFEPEHGLFGHSEAEGPDGIRNERGLRILSLFSRRKRPSPHHLRGLDMIVVDIQSLPVRCYTYISTLTYLMEAAERQGLELMILDRPNPYGFWEAQGSMLDPRFKSFVGTAPVPFLFSLTPGEYAYYMAGTRFRRLNLSVVRVAGYERKHVDGVLRQSWINPSPNIPSVEAALVYPGLVFFEGTNFSLGRGTTRPFVYSGAPWLDSRAVVDELRKLRLPGVQIAEVVFTPTASNYRGETCRGVQILPISTDFDPLRTGYEYMRIVRINHPNRFRIIGRGGKYFMDRLWGGLGYRAAISNFHTWDYFRSSWQAEADRFEDRVENFRLY